MWIKILVTCAALVLCGCNGSTPAAPAPPVANSAPISAAPVARMGVTIDSRDSLIAIQALSAVTFDASGSSGTGLRFGLDFGDGQGADEAVAMHVYTTGSKSYKARVIVTDTLGRTDSVAVDIVVKNVEGTWSNYFFNAAAKRYESRYLIVSAQATKSLTGLYTHPEGNNSRFAGELSGERGATISLTDRTITFASGSDGGFNSDATGLTVHVVGGSANGQTLTFSRYVPYSGY